MKINHLTVVTHTELAELYKGVNALSSILDDVRASGVCNTEANRGAGVINSLRQSIGKWSILHAFDKEGHEMDGMCASSIAECDVYAHGLFTIEGEPYPLGSYCPACAKEEEDADEAEREAKADAMYDEAIDKKAERRSREASA